MLRSKLEARFNIFNKLPEVVSVELDVLFAVFRVNKAMGSLCTRRAWTPHGLVHFGPNGRLAGNLFGLDLRHSFYAHSLSG